MYVIHCQKRSNSTIARSFHRKQKFESKAAVLVAIAIPVFTSRLEQSRETTDIANLRSAYAAAQVALLSGDEKGSTIGNGSIYYFNPNTSIGLQSDPFSIGQGTDVDGHADVTKLPAGCSYSTGKTAKDKAIKIVYGSGSCVMSFVDNAE